MTGSEGLTARRSTLAGRGNRIFPTHGQKRVRWADEEERSRSPLIIAVLVFNGLFLMLGLLGRWGLWTKPGLVTAATNTVQLAHEIQGVDLSPATGSHAVQRWAGAKRQADPLNATTITPLRTFQVDVPLLGQGGKVVGAGTTDGYSDIETTGIDNSIEACQVTLATNEFSNSFGQPFVGDYNPPDCFGDSNTVIMNLTVQSKGRQFDRLSIVYLGDVEIFRSSTEEPRLSGISWTYMKDMSHYMTLWKQPQKVIFDLPNSVNEMLNGTFVTTITVNFFKGPQNVVPADSIIPISARQSNNDSRPSVWTIPDVVASNVVSDFPRNAARAVFSVSATGQGGEEFWWTNVLESNTQTYNASNASLAGFSPFREVQVRIDDKLAGVQWPYPVIFTGGLSPSFWSPMVGIDAFDLKEGEIDISPWLGVLCDGQPHNFTVNVVGLDDDGQSAKLSTGVNSNWQVTGKIFVWLDPNSDSITAGDPPTIDGADPTISISQSVTQNTTGFNETLKYTTSVTRKLKISSSITTSTGTHSMSWSQDLAHTDNGFLSNIGSDQTNNITTTGADSAVNPTGSFSTSYSFPLTANVTTDKQSNGTTRFDIILTRGKDFSRSPPNGGVSPSGLQVFAVLKDTARWAPRLTGTSFSTSQHGTSTLFLNDNGNNTGSGGLSQTMRFGGEGTQWLGLQPDTELYFREVSVNNNGSVLADTERLIGKDVVGKRPNATGRDGPQTASPAVTVDDQQLVVDQRFVDAKRFGTRP